MTLLLLECMTVCPQASILLGPHWHHYGYLTATQTALNFQQQIQHPTLNRTCDQLTMTEEAAKGQDAVLHCQSDAIWQPE